jgi:Family of unknown function (DUF6247)
MTAQPIHAQPAPHTDALRIAEIRDALTEPDRARFEDEFGDAVDQSLAAGDFTAIERVKTRWWGQALTTRNPQLLAELEAAERGEAQWVPSPFNR